MCAAPLRIRAGTPVITMCAVVFLFLAVAVPAHAQVSGVTISPPNPVVGDLVTAEGPFRECPPPPPATTYTFTFTRHNSDGTSTVTASGSGTSSLNGVDYSTTVSQAGAYTVTEDAACTHEGGPPDHYSFDFTVGAALGGSIEVSPDPPVVNQSADLNVVPTEGTRATRIRGI